MSRGQLERGSGAEGRVCAGQSDGTDTSRWLVTETLCGNTASRDRAETEQEKGPRTAPSGTPGRGIRERQAGRGGHAGV